MNFRRHCYQNIFSSTAGRAIQCLLVLVLYFSTGLIVHAADANWTSSTSGSWSVGSNWSTGTAPGSTSLTTNMDVVTIDQFASGGALTITVDKANQNIGGILFALNGEDFIGSTTGNALLLSSGGAIKVVPGLLTASIDTINAPLVLEAASSTTGGIYSFKDDDNQYSNSLALNGAISGGATTGSITLGLTGLATFRSNVVSGAISNGSASGGLGITIAGVSSWTLAGSNTYTGNTTINGGTLILVGSLSSSSQLIMGGGTFTGSMTTSSQTLNGLTLTQGLNTIDELNARILNLGTITRDSGAMVDFDKATAGSVIVSNSGFLGPWAFSRSGANLSYALGGGGTAPVSAYTGGTVATAGSFLNMTSAAVNYTYTTSGSVTLQFDSTGNTLQLTSSNGIDLAQHTLMLNGLMASTSNSVVISDGTLAIGSSNELDIVDSLGLINIAANITGSGTVAIASLGGSVIMSGNNNYSGGTILETGTLDVESSTALGTGTLTINNGSGLTGGASISNAEVWNGSFTYSGHSTMILSGTIQLNGNPVVLTNSGTSVLDVTGPITGVGDLTVEANAADGIQLTGSINNTGNFVNSSVNTFTFVGVAEDIYGNIGSNVEQVIANSGTLILHGTNTYTGGTAIYSLATLIVSGSSNLGSGGVLDNGILSYSTSGATTENNLITGTGEVVNQNGTLIFAGANTFTGGLVVNGIVAASGAGTFGGVTGTITINNASILDLRGTNQITGGLSGTGTVLNSDTSTTSVLTLEPTSVFSYGGNIKDNGGTGGILEVVKAGAGIQYLSGTNTYSGGTLINSGTLALENSNSAGTGSIVDNATLTLYLTNVAFGNNVGGTGAVEVSSSGTVTITGSNSYVGGTILDAGNLALGSLGAIGSTGTITFNGGVLQFSASNTTDYSSRFSSAAGQKYYIDTNGQSVTFASGLTSITGSLIKYGAGVLTLAGTNNYSGGTSVVSGTLQVIGSGTLGSSTGSLTLYASTLLDLGSTTQTVGAVSIQGATIQNGTLNGTSFNISGTSTVQNTNLNGGFITISGTSNIQGGTLKSSSFVISGTSTIGANLTGTTNLLLNSGSNLVMTGQGSYTGTTTINGTLQVGNGGTSGSLGTGGIVGSSSGTLIYDRSDTYTEANKISGTLGLQQIGAGTLVLAGTNTFTGTINIQSGAIDIANGNALGSTSNVINVSSGAALQLQGGVTINNSINIAGSGISSKGSIENISGSNTITTPIVLNSASTIGSDSGTLTINSLTPILGSGTLTFIGSGNGIVTSNINVGTSSVIKDGAGTWSLTGNSNYSGATIIDNGTLKINSVTTIGSAQPLGKSGTLTLAGISSSTSAVLQYIGSSATMAQNIVVSTGDFGVINNTGGGVLTLSGSLNKNGAVLTLAGGNFVVGGQITGASANSDLDIGSAAYSGSATVGLTAANSYNGPTVITDGSTLLTGTTGAMPIATPSAVTLGGASDTAGQTNTLDLLGTNQVVASLNSTGPASNQVISSNGTASGTPAIGSGASFSTGTLTVNYSGGTTDTYSGSLGGSGAATKFGLTKSGTGTLALTGTNTYTGGTLITAGTLVANNMSGSATGTGSLTLNSGATLAGIGTINSTTNTINGSVQGGAPGLSTTGSLTLTSSGTTTFASTAKLIFNLAANGNNNEVNMSNSAVLFSGSTLTVNLVDSGSTGYASGLQYQLIAGTGGANQFSGITLDANNHISGLNLSLVGTTSMGQQDSLVYGASYLILTGGNIDIVVVPEPCTWTLLLAGMVLLFIFSRRHRLKFA
jgi:autotransporter-associated beta strand protein